MNNPKKIILFILLTIVCLPAFSKSKNYKKLKPKFKTALPGIYNEMGVIQDKFIDKKGFVANVGLNFDFSTAPYTFLNLNIDVGYAFNDFWEVYLTASPLFLSSERDFITQVREQMQFKATGNTPLIVGQPELQYGGYLVWAPSYGKDSFGSKTILRSDTFFKAGFALINYADAESGNKYHIGLGKTFFFTRWLGLRLEAQLAFIETPVIIDSSTGTQATNIEKNLSTFGFVNIGFNFYL